MPMNSALMPLLAFVGVIALIPVLLWLVRRTGAGVMASDGLLRTVSSLSLSPSQRVVVVALQQGAVQRWLVLGVSADRITPLTTVDAPEEVPLEIRQPQAPTVAQMIARWRGDKGGAQ
jgi:flagellar protein FliO/FliZ